MAQDMGHANDLLKAIQEFAERYLPTWLVTPLIAVGLLLLLFKYFGVGQAIGSCWRWLTTRTDRRRALRRAQFADHVESQMRRLGEKEEWRDTRYAELEAELEISGRRRRFRRTSLNSLRRVPSLSKALEACEDRIVLLEGEPGAGKSVAMRHLAQRMATRAMRKPGETSVIPIYVNLKTFRCDTRPTSADVRAFVMSSVNAVRDRDIERFLDDEFDRGLNEGTWLFLFDSFDEIPDILSATEANDVIVDYADAVHAFLHGMNKCRGIVASREFRGPGRAEWPTFRVVPLSEKRKKLLVEKSELPADIEDQLLGELPTADSGVQQMSGNPLFLGLLCEHMREGNRFPTNVHAVLETYLNHRLDRDAERLQGHFGVTGAGVRAVAEEFAFLIADQHSLGLEVPKSQAVRMLATATGRSARVAGGGAFAATRRDPGHHRTRFRLAARAAVPAQHPRGRQLTRFAEDAPGDPLAGECAAGRGVGEGTAFRPEVGAGGQFRRHGGGVPEVARRRVREPERVVASGIVRAVAASATAGGSTALRGPPDVAGPERRRTAAP